MKRTDADHHVGNLFETGNPLTGQRGTRLDHTWLNNVQEEIVAPILAAGVVPDGSDTSQLLQSMRYLGMGYPTSQDAQAAIAARGSDVFPDTVIVSRGHTTPGDGGGFSGTVTANNDPLALPAYNRLRPDPDTVNVKMFGARGDGATNDTVAFNAAIDWANTYSDSHEGGARIIVPLGSYFLPNGLTSAIRASDIHIVGAGHGSRIKAGNGVVFKWGDGGNWVQGGGLSNVTLEHVAGASHANGAIFIQTDKAARQIHRDIQLANVVCLASLGVDGTRKSGAQSFSGITGLLANVDAPAFDLRYGAGFVIGDSNIFGPGDYTDLYSSAPTSSIAPGRDGIRVTTGSWDTIVVRAGTIFNRLDTSFHVHAVQGTAIVNMWFVSPVFDGGKSFGLRLRSTGGTIRNLWSSQGWYVAGDGDGVSCDVENRSGGLIENLSFSQDIAWITGRHGFHFKDVACRKIFLNQCVARMNGRLDPVNARGLKMEDASDWQVQGGEFGVPDRAMGGRAAATQPHFGAQIGAGCIEYVMRDAVLGGSNGELLLEGHEMATPRRKVEFLRKYSGGEPNYVVDRTISASRSGVDWANSSPFRITVAIRGGDTSLVHLNGTEMLGSGAPGDVGSTSFTLEPGDRYRLTYATAPIVRHRIHR